jgi:hypothetical protein
VRNNCGKRFAVLIALGLICLDDRAADAQGFRPGVAAGKMTVADGLTVKLFAGEPEVRQPILVKCDDRGRLWTIQYLQYPNPAGLKRVKVDRWSRTFVDVKGVEPTNNTAERAWRPAVIDRKLSFGTQSESGSRFIERMLPVSETCRLQKRSMYDYLTKAVIAHFSKQAPPPLLPNP